MTPVAVHTVSQSRFSPYLVAVPFAAVIFGFYGTLLPFGLLGILGFAFVGCLWALLVGFMAQRLLRRAAWRGRLANTPILVSILATGLMAGGGLMYIFMLSAALAEPSTTYAVLSALMGPAVPYMIVLNSALEMLVMLLVIFFNWRVDRRRRALSLLGVAVYFVMRIWTYLVYAETRLAISTHPLSTADVDWFQTTLAADYRPVLVVLTHLVFILAALVPTRPLDWSAGNRARPQRLPAGLHDPRQQASR